MSNEIPGLIYLRDDNNTEVVLKVKRENITTERNFKINEQEMYSNNTNHHSTNFYHNGDDGLTFSCTVLFVNDINYSTGGKFTGEQTINMDNYNSKYTKSLNNTEYQRYSDDINTLKLIDAWYREIHPFNIVFGKQINLELPLVSKKWIITKLSMKQEADTLTEWGLTFRTYNPPKKISEVKNELVNRSTKSYKWKSNCKKSYKNLNYKKQSKKKFPKSSCVKLLHSILIELGYMSKVKKTVKTGKKDKKGNPITKTKKVVPDTWVYNKKKKKSKTSTAIKKFKKDWNKYNLKPAIKKKNNTYNDVIDKDTYTALCDYKKLKSSKKKK